jgi:hypothetical protein
MLYLKVLACKALFRELTFLSAVSDNVIDLTCFHWGLHDIPGAIVKALQAEIDSIDSGEDIHTTYPPYERPFDAILLGYGLCSNGIIGLSSKHYPLVIPRAHDCITLFLGSKERYQELYDQSSGGTLWYSPGWLESAAIIGEECHNLMIKRYTDKYGEQTAREMVENYERWQYNYTHLGLIEWPEFAGLSMATRTADFARQSADYAGWNLLHIPGDSSLLRDFLAGNWDEERFLIVPPGAEVENSYDDKIIQYQHPSP